MEVPLKFSSNKQNPTQKKHPTQMEIYTTEKIQSIKVAHYNSTIADTFGRIQIALNEHSRADMPFTFFRISSQFTQFFCCCHVSLTLPLSVCLCVSLFGFVFALVNIISHDCVIFSYCS